jgi:hypothetical protein
MIIMDKKLTFFSLGFSLLVINSSVADPDPNRPTCTGMFFCFLGHLAPDLFGRGIEPALDPDPSIIKQK